MQPRPPFPPMRDALHTSGRRGAGVLRWAERLLAIAGLAMLVWCALLITDASVSQRAARRSLEDAFHADLAATQTSTRPPTPTAAGAELPVWPVLRGTAVADLSIPRVHLSAVVLHGSDSRTLRRGPGHLENTAFPGESGNVVIAGHRDTFFRPLRNVEVGDDVFVDTPRGRFHYRVASLFVVKPQDLSVLKPTSDAVLTLITCYPFWVFGNAPDRFVVRAVGVVDAASAAFTAPAPRPHESIAQPGAQPLAAARSVVVNTRTVTDDETLVRQAIERFRLTYNARINSHHDVRPGGPLTFRACHVSTASDRAVATCDVSPVSADGPTSDVWTVILERADGGWGIRSIVER